MQELTHEKMQKELDEIYSKLQKVGETLNLKKFKAEFVEVRRLNQIGNLAFALLELASK